jgi:signal transduction histidine kinase
VIVFQRKLAYDAHSMHLLSYNGKKSRKVRLSIDPATEFRKILRVIEEVDLPAHAGNAENLKFAVLELINNSLRAHRENRVPRPIDVVFEILAEGLRVSIRDHGGGFDPAACRAAWRKTTGRWIPSPPFSRTTSSDTITRGSEWGCSWPGRPSRDSS